MAKSREVQKIEQEKAWRARWRAVDFSWDGLAKTRWLGWVVAPDGRVVEAEAAPEGALPATLQDYWREEEAHLIEGDGKRWTRAHCPLAWDDGSPTPKASWDEAERAVFEALLSTKLGAAGATIFKHSEIDGVDRRAQFCGCILFVAPSHPEGSVTPLSVRFEIAQFSGDVRFGKAQFSGDARFDNAQFSGNARFDNAQFSGNARFDNAQFSGDAMFEIARFSDNARFDNAQFSGYAGFFNAQFSSNAEFFNAQFSGLASFGKAQFSGDARFGNAQFSGNARFDNAQFSGDASFDNAQFSDLARFDDAQFSGLAWFENAQFSDEAWFQNAHFSGLAWFDNAQFSGNAWFVRAHFSGNAGFENAQFADGAWFDNAQFREQLSFRHSVFLRPAFFKGVVCPAAGEGLSAAFRGARFVDVADFSSPQDRAPNAAMIAAFDEAIFEKKLLLDDPDERSAEREFWNDVLPLSEKLRGDPKAYIEAEVKRRKESDGEAAKPLEGWEKRRLRLAARDRGLKELEGGCRAVKVAMGRERDEQMEQRYYRFQLIARRKQRGTPLAEKLYSSLYAGFSDYGMGLWQPFVTLLFMVLGFGALYWGWGELLQGGAASVTCFGIQCHVDPDFWDAMMFSANNVFRPFGVWGSTFEGGDDGRWIPGFLNAFRDTGEGHWMRLLIRLVASLQSLLSVILFFLFGLAVRRRFQIG